MQFDMDVKTRENVGKGVARTLRREGKIPGILYGQGESIALTMDPESIQRILHSESGSNALLNLNLTGGAKAVKRTAMLRDYQVDPLTGAILHADLFEVAMDKTVRVRVPVGITAGTPVGVTEGGVLQHNLRELHIECLPTQIPAAILVDAYALKINQGIHVKEIPVAAGVRIGRQRRGWPMTMRCRPDFRSQVGRVARGRAGRRGRGGTRGHRQETGRGNRRGTGGKGRSEDPRSPPWRGERREERREEGNKRG